jgi:hypothetical protein
VSHHLPARESVETDESVFDALGPTTHWYPRDPRYRRSGNAVPQIGDVAMCGWVKQKKPGNPAVALGVCSCLPCARLREIRDQGPS